MPPQQQNQQPQPKLTQLGSRTPLPASPEEAVLETFDNPEPILAYNVRFDCPEFTSNCPITGQPDYAYFIIDVIPDKKIVESKSLKLFLGSFRGVGSFHEACTMKIANRLIHAMKPKWLRISGFWYPRGGIAIDVFFQTTQPPVGVYIPEPNIHPHGGRG